MQPNYNITESNLDALWRNVKEYRQSKNFKAVMDACIRFRHLAPYNAMLVETQRPGAKYVLSEKEWRRKYDRGIKPNARPVIVLVPFGPVDFLFEINDTYPLKSTLFWKTDEDILEELAAPYKTKHDVSGQQLLHLMDQLCFHGIAIESFVAGASFAAKIELLQTNSHVIRIPYGRDCCIEWQAEYLLSVNSKAKRGETFGSICHELGHLYCQHLLYPRGWKPWKVRILPHAAKEFEAETISWLICELLGIGNPSEQYLCNYLNKNNEIPTDVSIEHILSATKDIWNMCMLNNRINYRDGLLFKHNEQFKEAIKQAKD